jgi:putative Mg2+ transporter-C (MgtC) family protein
MIAIGIQLPHLTQPFEFDQLQQIVVVSGAIKRLLLACLLGGLVGLEREANHKSAGVRTNLLICLGAALFTLMSMVLAGETNPDKSRVASNIVQGIGFLGAGLILRNRGRVSGLTSAASVWVVASVGMACGAGLYAAAAVAAVIVIVALELVGFLERRANLKRFSVIYEARGSDSTLMLQSILQAMDKGGERLVNVERDTIGALERVSFALTTTQQRHQKLRTALSDKPGIETLFTFQDPEDD